MIDSGTVRHPSHKIAWVSFMVEMRVEQETELCVLAGTPLPVDKMQRYLRGNFSKLNWQDLLLLASPLCESLALTLDLAQNGIRSDETIELSEKLVRPVIRIMATGKHKFHRSKIDKVIISTLSRVKNENPSQSVLNLGDFELPDLVIEQIQNFLRVHGEKRLDGKVQFALEDGKIFTVLGKLGPKPLEDISTIDTKIFPGVVDSIAYSCREIKVRGNGSKATTPSKFDLSQLKTLCTLLETQHPANFAIRPSLDAQGKKFDVLQEVMAVEDGPLKMVSRG